MAITSLKGARPAVVSPHLPRERRTMGIFPNLSVLDNFGIASLARDLRGGLLSMRGRRRRYEPFRDRLSIVARQCPDLPITSLSGGNQQKVLLARMLALAIPMFCCSTIPTRGVDIATRRVLYPAVPRTGERRAWRWWCCPSEVEEVVEPLRPGAGLPRAVLVCPPREAPRKRSERMIAAMFGRAA